MANKKPDNHTASLIAEIYRIDPSLKQFEADLPNLIATLENNRPEVTINETFVHELRTSLLSYKPAIVPAVAPNTHSLFWWLTRLAPVGFSLVLLFVLVPDITKNPTEPYQDDRRKQEAPETAPAVPEEMSSEMRMNAFMPERVTEGGLADDTSMFSLEAVPSSLEVAPPLAGDTLTITSLTLEAAGWIVVHKDEGGELGAVLHSSYVAAGAYQELPLLLTENIVYTEMVTVVVYTANNPEQFNTALESIQIDPRNDAPMMVTVPVISDLELQMME